MPSVVIGGETFEVVPLDAEQHASYRAYCVEIAKRTDSPIERFLAKCGGLSREERQDALAAWMQRPDWDFPTEQTIFRAAREPYAVAALARRTLRPAKATDEDWVNLFGQDAGAAYTSISRALAAIHRGPDEADILATNQRLRERLAGVAAPQDGKGEKCNPPPEGQ